MTRVERAAPADVERVEALLSAASLPLEGARDALALGVVGRDGGSVVAAAAIERFGAAGLLRSVVVDEASRGTGLGHAIVAAAEDLARSLGMGELYLLTETAIDWFPRLGYEVVDRAAAASVVGESIEFTTICRDTGVPMRKRLA